MSFGKSATQWVRLLHVSRLREVFDADNSFEFERMKLVYLHGCEEYRQYLPPMVPLDQRGHPYQRSTLQVSRGITMEIVSCFRQGRILAVVRQQPSMSLEARPTYMVFPERARF